MRHHHNVTKLKRYTIQNTQGLSLSVLNFGAIIQALETAEGQNLVLGFHDPNDYLQNNSAFYGAVIGCLANRVAQAQFECQQTTWQLEKNETPHCLHSGSQGLHNVYWQVAAKQDENMIECRYHRAAGEAGFPANVDLKVCYQLSDCNALTITYTATCDDQTPLDLTNHTYWNLSNTASILATECQFAADHYLPCSPSMIPTGAIASVEGTPLDFREWKSIATQIAELTDTHGYDHYFIANSDSQDLKKIACIQDPHTHIGLTVYSTEPGFQFYTGNFLPEPYRGFCIETQNYPNAINEPTFPSPVSTPTNAYYQKTVYQLDLP